MISREVHQLDGKARSENESLQLHRKNTREYHTAVLEIILCHLLPSQLVVNVSKSQGRWLLANVKPENLVFFFEKGLADFFW